MKIETIIDLESEYYCHKGSEITNSSKDDKTDKRKTGSELKRKDMQTVSHAVSHSNTVNVGKTNYIFNKVDNKNKKFDKRKYL